MIFDNSQFLFMIGQYFHIGFVIWNLLFGIFKRVSLKIIKLWHGTNN